MVHNNKHKILAQCQSTECSWCYAMLKQGLQKQALRSHSVFIKFTIHSGKKMGFQQSINTREWLRLFDSDWQHVPGGKQPSENSCCSMLYYMSVAPPEPRLSETTLFLENGLILPLGSDHTLLGVWFDTPILLTPNIKYDTDVRLLRFVLTCGSSSPKTTINIAVSMAFRVEAFTGLDNSICLCWKQRQSISRCLNTKFIQLN